MFGFLGVASPPLATLTWMVKRLDDCFEHEGFLVYLFSTTTSRLGSTVWKSGKPLKVAPSTPPYPGVWILVSENYPSETVWKIDMGFPLGSHKTLKRDQKPPYCRFYATKNT